MLLYYAGTEVCWMATGDRFCFSSSQFLVGGTELAKLLQRQLLSSEGVWYSTEGEELGSEVWLLREEEAGGRERWGRERRLREKIHVHVGRLGGR